MSEIDFLPVDGGGQAINIGSSANRSSVLTAGCKYHVVAEADCYWVAGSSSVDATTSDHYLQAGERIAYVARANFLYLSVIRKTTDVTGGFHICQAS